MENGAIAAAAGRKKVVRIDDFFDAPEGPPMPHAYNNAPTTFFSILKPWLFCSFSKTLNVFCAWKAPLLLNSILATYHQLEMHFTLLEEPPVFTSLWLGHIFVRCRKNKYSPSFVLARRRGLYVQKIKRHFCGEKKTWTPSVHNCPS